MHDSGSRNAIEIGHVQHEQIWKATTETMSSSREDRLRKGKSSPDFGLQRRTEKSVLKRQDERVASNGNIRSVKGEHDGHCRSFQGGALASW